MHARRRNLEMDRLMCGFGGLRLKDRKSIRFRQFSLYSSIYLLKSSHRKGSFYVVTKYCWLDKRRSIWRFESVLGLLNLYMSSLNFYRKEWARRNPLIVSDMAVLTLWGSKREPCKKPSLLQWRIDLACLDQNLTGKAKSCVIQSKGY